MKRYENDCVSCPKELGCLGSSCPMKNVLHYYCDECGDETDLYDFDGEELCIDCIKERLKPVE